MADTVEDLRTKLISLGMSPQEADEIKGKSNLVSKISELEANSSKFSVELDPSFTGREELVAPLMTDPKWSDYVLSHFTPDELFEGHPKIDGLRRVTELLIGKIVKVKSKIRKAPEDSSGRRGVAAVECRVVVVESDGSLQDITGVADAAHYNVDDQYGNHLCALAETRARGRALRQILRLSNVVSFEETTSKTVDDMPSEEGDFDPDKKMNASQLTVMKIIAKRCNINLWKFVNSGQNTYSSFNEIPYTVVSQKMLKTINEYQQIDPTTKELKKVPEHLSGYNEEEVNQFWTNNNNFNGVIMSKHIHQIIRDVPSNDQKYSQGNPDIKEDMKKMFKSEKKGKIEGFARRDGDNDD